MSVNKKLLELYVNKYIKNELNFHGIKLIPKVILVGNGDLIQWTIKNPNNISYNGFTIQHFITDSERDFFNLTNLNSWKLTREINDFSHIKNKHISNDFQNKINDTLKSQRYTEYKGIGVYFKIKDFYFRFLSDANEFEATAEYLKMTNLKDGSNLSEDKFLKIMKDIWQNGDYGEISDLFIDDTLNLFWNEPTLTDKNSTYFMSYVDLYNSKGKRFDPED